MQTYKDTIGKEIKENDYIRCNNYIGKIYKVVLLNEAEALGIRIIGDKTATLDTLTDIQIVKGKFPEYCI